MNKDTQNTVLRLGRWLALGLGSFLALTSCDTTENNDSGVDNDGPVFGAALDDLSTDRLVSVYLQAEHDSGFNPTYGDRIITAEPMSLVAKKRAEGKTVVQGISTTIIAENCAQLQENYPDLLSCSDVDAVEFELGEIAATVTTDSEGFAALSLQEGVKYRLSVKSWVSLEDGKCFWGGSEILEETVSTLAIPVLVFCE